MKSYALIEDPYYENRPYEFSFNIVDFQHRYEKKDVDGIITGEYGFITADGVYHETGYATDKNGDFIITKMRNRKITSLKDAREIFKDKPETARKLFEAVAKSCSGCKIPTNETPKGKENEVLTTKSEPLIGNKIEPILKNMMEVLIENTEKIEHSSANTSINEDTSTTSTKKNESQNKFETFPNINRIPIDKKENERKERVIKEMIQANSIKKTLSNDTKNNEIILNDSSLEKIANDLYYHFNYSITSHGHQETGYHNGDKNGDYRSLSKNGVDTRVKYVSNKFGHQPNITFHPRSNETEKRNHSLQEYSFLWNFA
ncbi:PREDICTED: protein lethal(3)malignant blood neoplasm 1 [Polistes dominula]|uniref:Protein lethal(3)malignant blood neoplasm 1 n=1 Tax=Polistes dominula TaxID=743375 RepID=A0ABM1HW16_POLDO|nr:PREDICTED: protein lethal(3)malignant blood neoplasm 1 [Polistes dominula]